MKEIKTPYSCPDEYRSPQMVQQGTEYGWMKQSTERSIEIQKMRLRWNTPEVRMANRAQYGGGATLCGEKCQKD